VLATQLATL
jgi:hypothetical protein